MARFTIVRDGSVRGTYEGADENAAMEAAAIADGFPDLASANIASGKDGKALTRDDYKCKKVEE
jgi:hypothetical protein